MTTCGCVTTPVSLADEEPPGREKPSFREGRSGDPPSGVLGQPLRSPASGVCGYDTPAGFPLGAAGRVEVRGLTPLRSAFSGGYVVPLGEEHLGFFYLSLTEQDREKQNVSGIAFDVKRKFSDLSGKKIEHRLAIWGGRCEDAPLGGTQPFGSDASELKQGRRVRGFAQSLVAVSPSLPAAALGHARLLGPCPRAVSLTRAS